MNRIERTVALAGALLFAATTACAAPNVFEGSASITGLKVEVIDLRPDDGVAAGFMGGKSVLSGNASWMTDVRGGFYDPLDYFEGTEVTQVNTKQAIKDVFGGPDFKFSVADNAASFGRQGGDYAAELAVQATSLVANGYTLAPTGHFSAEALVTTQSWVLKAGTEVRISGGLDLLIRNDASQFEGDLLSDHWNALQRASASAAFGLSVLGDATGVIVGPSEIARTVDTWLMAADEPFNQSRSEAFELVARNLGTTDVILNSRLLVSSRFTMASAIPEPSSWALMLAGLGLVSMVARRRQATPASSKAN